MRRPTLPAYPVFLGLGAASALFVGMIDPVVAVYYVRVVGLGPLELVLLGTVVEIAGLVCEVPTGIVADLYSRRLSVIIGIVAVGACFVVQGLLPFLLPIVVVAWFGAINVAFMLLSVAANEVARRRVALTDDTAVARALALTSLAHIAGVVVFGLAVARLVSLRAAMVAVGLTLVPALPLLARARRQAAAAHVLVRPG